MAFECAVSFCLIDFVFQTLDLTLKLLPNIDAIKISELGETFSYHKFTLFMFDAEDCYIVVMMTLYLAYAKSSAWLVIAALYFCVILGRRELSRYYNYYKT